MEYKRRVKQSLVFFVLMILFYYSASAGLMDVYKKGEIGLSPDPGFGRDTDWESLFFDQFKDIVVATDGSIFVADSRQHHILKFDRQGNLIKKFGRKGQGPGDFVHPGDVSILDHRYLIVGEYATNCRISVFDLDGDFIKVIKTRSPVYNPLALQENKIAFLSIQYKPGSKMARIMRVSVMIIDIETGEQRVISSYDFQHRYILVDNIQYGAGNLDGDVLIVRTKENNLLVGVSNREEVDIYSVSGCKIRSFSLNIKPTEVTDGVVEEFKKAELRHLRSVGRHSFARKLESTTLDRLFPEYLPLYKEILVDAEGNILVFKFSFFGSLKPEVFQVYDPGGRFVCQTGINPGVFDFGIDRRSKNITFNRRDIIAILNKREKEDPAPRLVRVIIKDS